MTQPATWFCTKRQVSAGVLLFESPPAPPNLLGIEKRISETTAIITEFEKECRTLIVRGCIKFSSGLKRFRRQPVTSKMAVKIDSLLRVLHGRWSIYGWPSSREKSGDTASFQGPFCCHYPRFILNSYSSEFQDSFRNPGRLTYRMSTNLFKRQPSKFRRFVWASYIGLNQQNRNHDATL